MGITFDKQHNKYRISCNNRDGVQTYYGLWDTLDVAEKVLKMLVRIGEVPPGGPSMKYIYLMNGKYTVLKTVDGHKTYYGRYEHLEDAVKRRDYLDSIDWKEAKTYRVYNRIERDDSMLYIYLNTDTGKYYIKKGNECYGTFRNLDDAKDERDYLVSIDWDYGDMY